LDKSRLSCGTLKSLPTKTDIAEQLNLSNKSNFKIFFLKKNVLLIKFCFIIKLYKPICNYNKEKQEKISAEHLGSTGGTLVFSGTVVGNHCTRATCKDRSVNLALYYPDDFSSSIRWSCPTIHSQSVYSIGADLFVKQP
jgi:hypothetical protein